MQTKKPLRFAVIIGLMTLALVLVAACSAPPPAGTTTATEAPTAAPAAPAAPANVQADTSAPVTDTSAVTTTANLPDFGPKPVMPADGERPLAEVDLANRAFIFQQPPDMAIDPGKVYLATFETTKGDFTAELYSQDAPNAVNNFVVLSEMGYYDGMPAFQAGPPMAVLTGDAAGDGNGSPGYDFPAEIGIPNPAGTIGYLRLPDQVNPEQLSNGSQLYITLEAVPEIDGIYSAFGYILDGLDVAQTIEQGDVINKVVISEAAERSAPTPPPPTPTPTPFAPTSDTSGDRPLAALDPAERNDMFNVPPEMTLEEGVDYTARIVTDKGDIVVDLYEDQTPITVNNFVTLANLGFYDNTTFHRVIEGFMAQAGDPTGTGTGGPGYTFQDEIVPDLVFDSAGILAMANAGPNTNGSQFFITYDATDWLNGQHTIFGKVLEGEDVLAEINLRDPGTATEPGTTIEQILIETK
ncbi:MAG: peptidylprolyl isomerase [Caldilineales bacterium]